MTNIPLNDLNAVMLGALLPKAGWREFSGTLGAVISEGTPRAIYECLRVLHERLDGDVTPDTLRLEVLAIHRGSAERAEELTDAVEVIKQVQPPTDEEKRGTIHTYASHSYLAQAVEYCSPRLGTPSLDPGVVLDYVQRAVDVAAGQSEGLVCLGESPLPNEAPFRPGLVSLGLSSKLDRVLGGGIASGELGILLAPSSRGKTTLLCACGAHRARQGDGVIGVALDEPARRVIWRYYNAITGKNKKELIADPNSVAVAREGMEVRIWNRTFKDTTPADIRGMVLRQQDKTGRPGILIVDYLQKMSPNRTRRLNRAEQYRLKGQLGEDMRQVGLELDLPVLTAWQVNRVGADEPLVKREHISESWEIINHADIIIGLNRTHNDADMMRMRFNIIKQRDNSDMETVVPAYYDPDRAIIRDWTDEDRLRGEQRRDERIRKRTL